ncbi:MAG TPA: response regulator transcription factor [Chloroflexota bacterium]|nr:response regulator transcription factor [Chloroflexota bacterium]
MSSPGARILVVDDEPEILRWLGTSLGHRGFDVVTAESGREALEQFGRRRPDLIVLDLALPDVDGLEVIRRVRAEAPTPIVVLSVQDAEPTKIEALDLGADDYVTKPFGMGELLARVRVALRHAAGRSAGADPTIEAGPIVIDVERRLVTVAGREVRLTPIEYDLLRALAEHPNRVFTRRMLLQRVWGPDFTADAHYLHVHVANLRRKIEPDPSAPRYLLTEPGVGYRLSTDSDLTTH